MNIVFEEKALKQLSKLDKKTANKIIEKIEQLKKYPYVTNIKKLKNFYPPFRLRVNNFRILFDIEDEIIIIFEILQRKDAY